VKDLQREAEILRKVNHENIIKLLKCEISASETFLMFEYIGGNTLFDLLHVQRKKILAILQNFI